ncbi:Brain and acute leukemia cytoplasmic protein, partial [Ophiophagus hannah]
MAAGILEDSKSTQTCMAKSSISSGMAIPEKKAHCATQCTKLSTHTTGNAAQKPQNSFRTSEYLPWEQEIGKSLTSDNNADVYLILTQPNSGH